MSKYAHKNPPQVKCCPVCYSDFRTHYKARFCSQKCKNAFHYRKRTDELISLRKLVKEKG